MTLIEHLGSEWYKKLEPEFKKEYFRKLSIWLKKRRASNTIYPDAEDTFKAFRMCPFSETKVVILGQDPYYDGTADGLAFSYKEDVLGTLDYSKSLDIIWKELEDDVRFGIYLSFNYNLNWLAEQGVLLLNSCLTVYRGRPGSHSNVGWEKFTGRAIKLLLQDSSPKVFMLWGSKARNFFSTIIPHVAFADEHLILQAPHPAYDLRIGPDKETMQYSARYPETFRGCKHFSKANEFLKENNREQIIW